MSARLYPGFGSGRGNLELVVKVNSFATIGRDDLEAGDKLLLPASAFKEITRLKLPFPLTFQLHNDKTKPLAAVPDKKGNLPPAPPEQFAGVLEFSSPEGQAYIPAWMMANMRVREGAQLRLTTVKAVPTGAYVKFRPYDEAFVELAGAIGPRELLETALRNYSVLSTGEKIIIDVADVKYALDVMEVKPGTKISLFGHVDLEVDFAPIDAKPTVTAPRETKATAASESKDAPSKLGKAPTGVSAGAKPGASKEGVKPAASGAGTKTVAPAISRSAISTATSKTVKDTLASTAVASRAAKDVPIAAGAGRRAESTEAEPSPVQRTPVKLPRTADNIASPSGHSAGAGIMWFPEMESIAKGTHSYGLLNGPGAEEEPTATAVGSAVASSMSLSRAPDRAMVAQQMRAAALRRLQSQDAAESPSNVHVQDGWLSQAAEQRAKERAKKAIDFPTPSRRHEFKEAEGKDAYESKEKDYDFKETEAFPMSTPVASNAVADGALIHCAHCDTDVSASNYTLHVVHCRRSAAYHKVVCKVCEQPVFQKDMALHIHCPDCCVLVAIPSSVGNGYADIQATALSDHAKVCDSRLVSCECGAKMCARDLPSHKSSCPHVLVSCKYCKVSQRRGNIADHEHRCGARTGECEFCGKLVVLKHMASHQESVCHGLHPELRESKVAEDQKETEDDSKLDFDDSAAADPTGVKSVLQYNEREAKASMPKATATRTPSTRSIEASLSASLSRSLNVSQPSVTQSMTSGTSAPRGREVKATTVVTGAGSQRAPSKGPASAAPRTAARGASDTYPCPHCSHKCRDYEDLQMHVFTACTKSGEVPAAPRPSVSRGSTAGVTARPSISTSTHRASSRTPVAASPSPRIAISGARASVGASARVPAGTSRVQKK